MLMQVLDWNNVPREQLNPLFTRQMIHTPTMTIARILLRRGCVVPEHSHHNEQVSTIESGRLKFVFGDEVHVVGAGQSICIPPNVPHSAEALDDCTAVDIFTPPREDWIRGDDAYLRKKTDSAPTKT